MKSPQGLTIVIALIFSGVTYVISSAVELTPILAAVLVFVAAFVSPLFGSDKTSTPSEGASAEIKTLYVGNLPYRANESVVRSLFAEYGQVHSVRLMKDKHTGKRRGFGFVEISESDAEKVISALNDTEFQQRTLKVREAKERPEKGSDD